MATSLTGRRRPLSLLVVETVVAVVVGSSLWTTSFGNDQQQLNVVRVGVLSPGQSTTTTREVQCSNITGESVSLVIHTATLDLPDAMAINANLRSLLLLAVDVLMVNASNVQRVPSSLVSSLQPLEDNGTHTLVSRHVPVSDTEWCCTFCCHGNTSDSDVTIPGALLNDTVKVQFISAILKSLKWETAFILFDDDHEDLMRSLTTELSMTNAGTRYILTKTTSSGTDPAVKATITATLMSTDNLNGIIVCSLPCIQQILGMTLSLESTFKRRVSVIQSTKWLLVPPEIGSTGVDILTQIFALGFDNIGLVVNSATVPPEYRNTLLQEVPCSVMTVSTLLWKEGGRRELSPVGHYCPKAGPLVHFDVFPNTNFGFNGRNFIVSTMLWDPYIMKREENGSVVFYGLCADLLNELSRTLNFTFAWTQPPDMSWGHNNSGNWSGLVGQLNRQEVDLTMAPLAMSKEREEAMDFTFPFYHDFSGVLLQRPDPNANRWRTYIDIFRWEVLMCIGLTLLGGSVVCVLIDLGEKSLFGKAKLRSAINTVWILIGALLAQGCRRLPHRGSGRLFLSSWWIFSIVLAATYSGNLIASLTVTKDRAPFDTLTQMVKQTEYTYGTIDQSMWTMLFEFSTSPTYQAIHRNMHEFAKEDPRVLDPDPYVHLQKVREGGYAYIADTGLFTSWLATNCDLMLIKEKFYPSKYAVGLPNDSAYTKLFSDQIMKIYESGLLQVWIKRWWPKRNFCGGALSTEARVLNLIDMQSVFYLAGVGVGLSAMALLVEHVIHTACLARSCVAGPSLSAMSS